MASKTVDVTVRSPDGRTTVVFEVKRDSAPVPPPQTPRAVDTSSQMGRSSAL